MIESVAQDIKMKVEVLMEMYEAMEKSCVDLNDKSIFLKYQGQFKRRVNEM